MANHGLFDSVFEELLTISAGGFEGFLEDTQHDANKRLIRKLRQNYATMSLDEVTSMWNTLGHRSDETPPCDVCKVIAEKEFQLAED